MSQLWAAKAAHKNNTAAAAALIPGSSRWVSNELSLQFSAILDADEEKNSLFVKRYSQLNTFMNDVMNGSIEKSLLNEDEENGDMEYVVSEENARVIPDVSFDISKDYYEPATIAPNEHTVPVNIDTSFVIHDPMATSPGIDKILHGTTMSPPHKAPSTKESSRESSFSAISRAVRKSIADRTGIVFDAKSPIKMSSKTPTTEISFRQTPKRRSSMFVSLPARTPIVVQSTSKPKKIRKSKIYSDKTRSSILLDGQRNSSIDKIQQATKAVVKEKNSLITNFVMSPVKVPNNRQLLQFESRIPQPIAVKQKQEYIKSKGQPVPLPPASPPAPAPLPPISSSPEHKSEQESPNIWTNVNRLRSLSPVKLSPIKQPIRMKSPRNISPSSSRLSAKYNPPTKRIPLTERQLPRSSPQRQFKTDSLSVSDGDLKLLSPPKLQPTVTSNLKQEDKKSKTIPLKRPIIEAKSEIRPKPKKLFVGPHGTLHPPEFTNRLTRPKSEIYEISKRKTTATTTITTATTPTPTPKTPLRITAETLPHVLTDDEDDPSPDKDKKVLQDWARSPELRKSIIQNKSINGSSVFGKEPTLDLYEVFENCMSSERGCQSPERTPDMVERKREEREYMKKMGYL